MDTLHKNLQCAEGNDMRQNEIIRDDADVSLESELDREMGKTPLTEAKIYVIITAAVTVVMLPITILKCVKGYDPTDVFSVYFSVLAAELWCRFISTGKKKLMRWVILVSIIALSFIGMFFMEMLKAKV